MGNNVLFLILIGYFCNIRIRVGVTLIIVLLYTPVELLIC